MLRVELWRQILRVELWRQILRVEVLLCIIVSSSTGFETCWLKSKMLMFIN